MVRFIMAIILVMIVACCMEAQILTEYDLTTTQRDYIEWAGKSIVKGVEVTDDLQKLVASQTDTRLETIRMKWLAAKAATAQIQRMQEEWHSTKHPAPFHESDSLILRWIMSADSVVRLGFLSFYSELDSINPYSRPITPQIDYDVGILLILVWKPTCDNLKINAMSIIKTMEIEAMSLPRKRQ